jgi:hypothetical protein
VVDLAVAVAAAVVLAAAAKAGVAAPRVEMGHLIPCKGKGHAAAFVAVVVFPACFEMLLAWRLPEAVAALVMLA